MLTANRDSIFVLRLVNSIWLRDLGCWLVLDSAGLVNISATLVASRWHNVARTGKVCSMMNSALPLDQIPATKTRSRKFMGIHLRYWLLWAFSPLLLGFWVLFLDIGSFIQGFRAGFSGAEFSPRVTLDLLLWQKVVVDYCFGALIVVWVAHFEKKALLSFNADIDSACNRHTFFPWQERRLVVEKEPADILQQAAEVLTAYDAVIVKFDEGSEIQAVTAHTWRGFGRKISISVSRNNPCNVDLHVAPRSRVLFLIVATRFITDYGNSWQHMQALVTRMTTGVFPVTLSPDGAATVALAPEVDKPQSLSMVGAWQRVLSKSLVLMLLVAPSFSETTTWSPNAVWAAFLIGICIELFVYFKFRQQVLEKRRSELQESFEFALHNSWIMLVLFMILFRPTNDWRAGEHISIFIWAGLILLLTAVGLRDMKSERGQRVLATTRREKAELERQLSDAKLVALSAQIEPHFLFNTLASIQYLIRNDTNKAGEMTSDLIRYLRLALPRMKQATARLADELDLVRAYLGIMQIRMGARLQFAIDSPDDLGDVPIPTMTLITLVENAIKHGLEQKPDGGMINLIVSKDAQILRLEVADTGGGFSTAASGTGIGLANIRERLHTLYGNRAHLELEANQPTGVRAILILPIEKK